MEDDFNFDFYAVGIDTDCISQDVDDYDLYAERIEDFNTDNFGDDIEFEHG